MFKLVAFIALVAVVAARPGYLGHHHYATPIVYESAPIIHEPVLSIPHAISHQSQTIVHSKPIITPILGSYHHTPIVNSIHSPLIYGYGSHYHHHY